MQVRVQKFGGSSVKTIAQIKSIAEHLVALKKQGNSIIAVVSAMGDTTDDLCELAQEITHAPNRRELDMLLSTGERVSMALLSMAINNLGTPAISFTGSQAGILTDGSHNSARIISIKSPRVEEELRKGSIVVLAGFQGVNPDSKEITTLGRGGSDLTAVAMAAHFRATRCDILKDVHGVFSADPRIIKGARHLTHLNYEQLLEMTFWGAQVLHYRSVELAQRLNVPLCVGLAPTPNLPVHMALYNHAPPHTWINGENLMFEQNQILSVNSHADVRRIEFQTQSVAHALEQLKSVLIQIQLPWPQILDSDLSDTAVCALYLTAPKENLLTLEKIASDGQKLKISPTLLSSVTATGYGAVSSDMASRLTSRIEGEKIRIQKIIFGALSLTFLVDQKDRERTVQAIHSSD